MGPVKGGGQSTRAMTGMNVGGHAPAPTWILRAERQRRRASDRLKLASLRGESSNQLLETLEEWNDHLERYSAPPKGVAILNARRCRVFTGFPGSFGLYPRRTQASGS